MSFQQSQDSSKEASVNQIAILSLESFRISVNAYDCSVMIGDFKSFLNVNDLSILEVNGDHHAIESWYWSLYVR